MEDVRGSDTATRAYYRLLDCGFRPGIAAGTDYPCGGRNPASLGNLLTYVHVPDGKLTYRKWIEGLAAGRTAISCNAHNEFLQLRLNRRAGPGDEVKLKQAVPGAVEVTWTSRQLATGTIELVQNGAVMATKNAVTAPFRFTLSLLFDRSGWICARRMGEGGHASHTAAVFVTVGARHVRANSEDARFFVRYLGNLLEKTEVDGE
jgi:hypothetical protein